MADKMEAEVTQALHLLDNLTKHDPPLKPLGELNPKLLAQARAVFLYHTKKIGLGIGVKWGQGLLVRKLADKSGSGWSQPVLFKVSEASAGLLAGFGTAQSMLLLGTARALEKFNSNTNNIIVGSDFKVVAVTDLGLGAAEDSGSLGPAGDAVSLSHVNGVMADWSIVGGTVSFDAAANAAVYGPGVDADRILAGDLPPSSGPVVPSVASLHEALNEIIAAADQDPRKFTGFSKRWKPQNVFQDDFKMHQGVDAHQGNPSFTGTSKQVA